MLIAAARFAAVALTCAMNALPALQRRRLLEAGQQNDAEGADSPRVLALTLMLWNRALLLMFLAALLWALAHAFSGWEWGLPLVLLAYVWTMDTALPLAMVSADPARWVERLTPIYLPVHRALSPLTARWAAPRERAASEPDREKVDDAPPSDKEMEAFLEEGEAEGILEEEDSELIRNVVNLGDTVVREVMTPRNRILAVPSSASLGDVWETFRISRRSRLPVYGATPDNITGLLLLKDVIQLPVREGADWRGLVKAPLFVPESKPTLELLRELQRAHTQMAIVVDEYGDLAGLATVEDLLEEVVGEIEEEHESSPTLHECGLGVFSVPGETHIDDLAVALGLDLEHDDFDTVAGLVMWKLGRIPNPLDTVHLDGLTLRVMKMEGQRIILVEARLEGLQGL